MRCTKVRESRGDEFTAKKRRNTNVEQKRERMIGGNHGDFALCGGNQSRGLLRITRLIASRLRYCSLALPSKHKPSRFIFGNTMDPNVAAAECALAARAAQRRAN